MRSVELLVFVRLFLEWYSGFLADYPCSRYPACTRVVYSQMAYYIALPAQNKVAIHHALQNWRIWGLGSDFVSPPRPFPPLHHSSGELSASSGGLGFAFCLFSLGFILRVFAFLSYFSILFPASSRCRKHHDAIPAATPRFAKWKYLCHLSTLILLLDIAAMRTTATPLTKCRLPTSTIFFFSREFWSTRVEWRLPRIVGREVT